jgi:hypothetical protein
MPPAMASRHRRGLAPPPRPRTAATASRRPRGPASSHGAQAPMNTDAPPPRSHLHLNERAARRPRRELAAGPPTSSAPRASSRSMHQRSLARARHRIGAPCPGLISPARCTGDPGPDPVSTPELAGQIWSPHRSSLARPRRSLAGASVAGASVFAGQDSIAFYFLLRDPISFISVYRDSIDVYFVYRDPIAFHIYIQGSLCKFWTYSASLTPIQSTKQHLNTACLNKPGLPNTYKNLSSTCMRSTCLT